MDIHKIDPDYDCGNTNNRISNLPPEKLKWFQEYSAQCDAYNAKQDKKATDIQSKGTK